MIFKLLLIKTKSSLKSSYGQWVYWTYFEYSMLPGKPTSSVSVWNSYATLREHTFGASMEEEDGR